MLVTISLLPHKNDRQQSVNDFWASILDDQTAMQQRWDKFGLLAAFMGKNGSNNIATVSSLNALVFNLPTMHAMSHRSDFFLACSSKVNILEPAFYLTITYPLTVTQIELRKVQFPTAMSGTKSQNTWLLEVMISSTNERVFIRDLISLNLQIVFDAWWASMNVGSKRPIAWNTSSPAPLWRFYLHYRVE